MAKYDLKPFNIRVQTLERTFVDKVFALCDYAVANDITGYSRHIYDLYKLLDKVTLDSELKSIVKEVREERKTHARCYTSDKKYNIPSILKEIIDKMTYYKDYKEITEKVLYDGTEYETAIEALHSIISSEVFET